VSHTTYDLDPRKHVNHAACVSSLEQAKGAFFVDVLDTSLADADTAVRTLELDCLAPIHPDRTVRVSLGPIDPGETSYIRLGPARRDGNAAPAPRRVTRAHGPVRRRLDSVARVIVSGAVREGKTCPNGPASDRPRWKRRSAAGDRFRRPAGSG
jgi:hypothetical protein